ncbi:MAG: arylesterase [Rhizobiaceae bacterium]|nr:arylesterase [Rhizobiaceae bacterium]
MPFKRLFAFFAILAIAAFGVARSAGAEPYRIVGFGDSLMAGYQLGPGESFPEKLQVALKAKGLDVEVAGAGVSGDTTSGGLARLDWSVSDGTDLVVLELGGNDMLRGIAPELTEKNLDAILSRLNERGIRVLLVGMLAAPNLGPEYAEAFNGIYPRLAEKYGVPLYPFFLDGVAADLKLLQSDGIHPTAEGVDIMVERMLPFVEKVIGASSGNG